MMKYIAERKAPMSRRVVICITRNDHMILNLQASFYF
jgi:hypothetical protein